MTKLKEFYTSFGFIIMFMFLSVLISALFGKKFLNKFLILILTSQLLLNSDKAITLIDKFKLGSEKVNNENNKNNNNNNKENNSNKENNKNLFSGDIIGDVVNGKLENNYTV